MRKRSINPGFFLRYFVAPTLAFAVLAAPTAAQAANNVDTSCSQRLGVVGVQALFGGEAQLDGKVNINTGSSGELELLPGIGPSTAQKIIAYRAKYPFKETLHLLRVKGVGRKTYEKIKPFLTVEGPSDLKSTKSKSKSKSKSKAKAEAKH